MEATTHVCLLLFSFSFCAFNLILMSFFNYVAFLIDVAAKLADSLIMSCVLLRKVLT
jgi:hypothetical protein